jgi:hypothetical protein
MKRTLASQNDFKGHIGADPRTVHGIMNMARTVLAAAIAAAKAALTYDNVANAYLTSPFIQHGVAASSPVTFDVAYKAATTPMVVGLSDYSSGKEIVNIHARSNTGFSFTNKYSDDSAGAGNVLWIAIGERA